MNPQPPVTRMRTPPSNSADAGALADFPTLRDHVQAWKAALAQAGWTPWLILALAVVLRFFLLGIKPPHFDEGINGWFVDNDIVKQGFYKYDPTNYHGPLHFYVLWLSETLFGRNIWALRLPVVVVSSACVWLTLKFEPLVGRTVSRMAALAMAVSPGFVFYGRYSIHEVWMLLFTMLFIFGLLGLWEFGTRKYLWYLGVGIAGMILSKETYIIHVGCAVVALAVLQMFHFLVHKASLFLESRNRRKARAKSPLLSAIARMTLSIGGTAPAARPARQTWNNVDLAMVIAVAVALIIFFYSGTFFHWSGVKGLYEAYTPWFTTGSEGHGHEKPWYYWLKLMAPSGDFSRADCLGYELPALAGLVLCLFSLRLRSVSLRYLAIYGVGTLITYSIVHYKTPWCIINIIWPLLFIFGVANLIIPAVYKTLTYILSAFLLSVSLISTIWLNYFHCTTDTEPYVYVQTYNDIYKLTDPLLKLAGADPIFYQLTGHIIRASAYPLPWILGDFPNVGYYEHNNSPPRFDADFLLVQEDRIQEVEAKLHESYFTEPLRIRPYQDTSKLYLNARIFKGFFPGQLPDFVGKESDQEKSGPQ
jgi:uncharacterized protein (TIGR03663 family)